MVTKTRTSVLGYSGMHHRSATAAPVERLDNGRSRYSAPDHHTAPAPITGKEADEPGSPPRPENACGAPESTEQRNHHDVPHRDREFRRSSQFHAPVAPSRHRRQPRRRPSLLSDERLRQLPRCRSDVAGRQLPHLRSCPAPQGSLAPELTRARAPAGLFPAVAEPPQTQARHGTPTPRRASSTSRSNGRRC